MDASWEMLGIAGVLGETECCIMPSTFLWTICKGMTFQHPTENIQKPHVTYIWPNGRWGADGTFANICSGFIFSNGLQVKNVGWFFMH